jgi:hypothetical protein
MRKGEHFLPNKTSEGGRLFSREEKNVSIKIPFRGTSKYERRESNKIQ